MHSELTVCHKIQFRTARRDLSGKISCKLDNMYMIAFKLIDAMTQKYGSDEYCLVISALFWIKDAVNGL